VFSIYFWDFSLIAGLFMQIIPVEIYNILIPLFISGFITIGLSGIIFTAKDQKAIRSIIYYLCYTTIILIAIYCLPLHPGKAPSYSIGLISDHYKFRGDTEKIFLL
jgi:hypothetical protein